MLGGQIKNLRLQKKLAQVELAKRSGITQAYLAQLETGARKNPSLLLLRKIAKVLGVNLAELVREGDHL